MKIARLNFSDKNEVLETARMFAALICEIFAEIARSDAQEYLREVMYWKNKDVFLVKNESEICGFIMGYAVSQSFTKAHYIGEYGYVKEKYRNTKAAHLLYHKIIERADDLNLAIFGKAYNNSNVKGILEKFADRAVFVEYFRDKKR